MRRLRQSSIALLLALLAACGALGIQPPQTFSERALAATATINGASQAVFDLLRTRQITPDDSDRYMDRLDQAQLGVNAARKLYSTDPADAATRLDAIILTLETIQAELRVRS